MTDINAMWRKSSYSGGSGGQCVEVANATWRKSSFSSGQGGECVEVGNADGVAVRDTTDREGATLTFSAEAWGRFTASLR